MTEPALTSSMIYAPSRPAVRSRQFTTEFNPTNQQTANPDSTTKIDIDGQAGQYLNQAQSVFTFKVNNSNSTDALSPDGGAWSFIRRLEVYCGSNLLESIDEYGAMYTLMMDCQVNGADRGNNHSISSGCNNDDNSICNTRGRFIAPSGNSTYSIPLISGVVGGNCPKYLPLDTTAPLRLEVTWASVGVGGVNSGTTGAAPSGTATGAPSTSNDWTVTDCTYVGSIIQLDADAERVVQVQTGGTGNLAISTNTYRNYNTTLASASSSLSFLIACKATSLNAIYVIHRNQTSATGGTNDAGTSVGGRSKMDMTKYQFKIGNQNAPQTQVDCADPANEAFQALMGSLHAIGDTTSHTCINNTTYNLDNVTDGTDTNTADNVTLSSANDGKYAVGIELESYSHKTDVSESGVNTLGSQIFFEGTYDSTPAASRVDAYCNFSARLELVNGLYQMRF